MIFKASDDKKKDETIVTNKIWLGNKNVGDLFVKKIDLSIKKFCKYYDHMPAYNRNKKHMIKV